MELSRDPDRLHMVPSYRKRNFLNFILSLVDLLAIIFAFQCSYLLNYPGEAGFFFLDKYLLRIFIGSLPLWLLILYLIKFTEIPTKHYISLFLIYLHSAFLLLFAFILCCFFFKPYLVSRLFLFELPFFGFFFLYLTRILKHKAFKNFGAHGYNHFNIIIIADDSSMAFIEDLLSRKGLGYKIVVIFTESAVIKDRYEKLAIILPEKYLGILDDLIEVDLIDEVLYLKNDIIPSEIRETVKSCEELGVTLRLRYNDPKVSLSSAVKTDIANGKFLSFINIPHISIAVAIRKTLNINLSLSLLIFLLPIFIIICILIKLTSKGPVISKQEKTGFRGRQFYLYNFRTEMADSDHETDYMETKKETDVKGSDIKEGAETTKTGRFLRKSGLDQLPKLFNVLKGDIPLISLHHPLTDNS